MPNTEMSREDLIARIAQLEAATKSARTDISFKISDKGVVSVYGFGRFPTSLYLGQWRKLIAHITELEEFLNDNAERLEAFEAEFAASKENKPKKPTLTDTVTALAAQVAQLNTQKQS